MVSVTLVRAAHCCAAASTLFLRPQHPDATVNGIQPPMTRQWAPVIEQHHESCSALAPHESTTLRVESGESASQPWRLARHFHKRGPFLPIVVGVSRVPHPPQPGSSLMEMNKLESRTASYIATYIAKTTRTQKRRDRPFDNALRCLLSGLLASYSVERRAFGAARGHRPTR